MDKNKTSQAITVRFSMNVYEWLVVLAEQEKRSLNSQISYIVEQVYKDASRPNPAGMSPAGAAYVERNVAPATED
jgi:hypothetical protein